MKVEGITLTQQIREYPYEYRHRIRSWYEQGTRIAAIIACGTYSILLSKILDEFDLFLLCQERHICY
jgi:hypothetical protein